MEADFGRPDLLVAAMFADHSAGGEQLGDRRLRRAAVRMQADRVEPVARPRSQKPVEIGDIALGDAE